MYIFPRLIGLIGTNLAFTVTGAQCKVLLQIPMFGAYLVHRRPGKTGVSIKMIIYIYIHITR